MNTFDSQNHYIFDLIRPVICDCNSPEEAREKVLEWGKFQEPRDAAIGLMAIDFINSQFKSHD